jgi:hypothetical protein
MNENPTRQVLVINSNQDQESRAVRRQPGSLLSNLDTPWPAALGMSRILPRVMVTRNNEGRIREPGGDPHARARARVRGLRSPVHWRTR